MTPFEKLDFLMSQQKSIKTRMVITLSRDRLNCNDVSYQRPSVPINSDFKLFKKERKPAAPIKAPPQGLFDITNLEEQQPKPKCTKPRAH